MSTQANCHFEDAMQWCWDNGIKIYFTPLDRHGKELKIVLVNNGVKKVGTQIYNVKNVSAKMKELYIEIYTRNFKKNNK